MINIRLMSKKRITSKSVHQQQRYLLEGIPIMPTDCYGRTIILNGIEYEFDRFDEQVAVFIDKRWDES